MTHPAHVAPTPDLIAAVDLGSNSFHLVIARVVRGDLQVIDRLKESVQLAAGLTPNHGLTAEAQERALQCLARFGQRLRTVPPQGIRAIGTSAFRQATEARTFSIRAEAALGHPIEVVSGQEEARLIYQGVSHTVAPDSRRRLVVDIGGGSTECIVGTHYDAETCESLPMGCVSFSQRFFPDGDTRPERFKRAVVAAQRELQTVVHRISSAGWEIALGSSGTIGAIDEIVRAQRWGDGGISAAALARVQRTLEQAGRVDKAQLAGLKPERHGVIAGGLAILVALFDSLSIGRMTYSQGAMREGILHDLVGRIRHEDVRDRTTRRMASQFHADEAQAERVERLALAMLRDLAFAWELEDRANEDLLRWAARLHEIGLAISHSGHHRHGAYVVEHADLPGFSRPEQAELAALIRAQRKRVDPSLWAGLPAARSEALRRLAVILRLSVLLHRGRPAVPVPLDRVDLRGKTLRLRFPSGWLENHALTAADLDAERADFGDFGLKLEFG